ncbi:MAG: 2-keto-3-deoxygluconate permease [Ruoffia tabacinasalis]
MFGAGINLFDALQSGLQGILLTVIFYVLLAPILVVFEQRILHEDGVYRL